MSRLFSDDTPQRQQPRRTLPSTLDMAFETLEDALTHLQELENAIEMQDWEDPVFGHRTKRLRSYPNPEKALIAAKKIFAQYNKETVPLIEQYHKLYKTSNNQQQYPTPDTYTKRWQAISGNNTELEQEELVLVAKKLDNKIQHLQNMLNALRQENWEDNAFGEKSAELQHIIYKKDKITIARNYILDDYELVLPLLKTYSRLYDYSTMNLIMASVTTLPHPIEIAKQLKTIKQTIFS